jgi:hypothetical protein
MFQRMQLRPIPGTQPPTVCRGLDARRSCAAEVVADDGGARSRFGAWPNGGGRLRGGPNKRRQWDGGDPGAYICVPGLLSHCSRCA